MEMVQDSDLLGATLPSPSILFRTGTTGFRAHIPFAS